MRLIHILKSKIDRATITKVELNYQGSVGIDKALLEASGVFPGEKVQVLNYNNGSRIETYVIEEKKNSGTISLYGPAARCGLAGDKICIISYALVSESELKNFKPRIILVDKNNKVVK
jgi:aspartate 1-decarboxylase